MSLFALPNRLDLVCENTRVDRPNGGVTVPIDGADVLARVGQSGHLDFDSIRVDQAGVTLRDTLVHFVRDADSDAIERPRGTLRIRLWKQIRRGRRKSDARTVGSRSASTSHRAASPRLTY